MTAMSVGNANQFIGSTISLVSKSEIRYEGILYSLNLREATISLAKVRSFGTEDRPTERPIPQKDEIYEFIIFRGSDIKGIDVLEPPKQDRTMPCGLPSDPAIIEVSHFHSQGGGHNCNSLEHSMRYASNNREGVFDGLLRGNQRSQGGRRSGPTSDPEIQVDRNNRNNGGRNNYNNRNMDGRSRNDNYRSGPGRNDSRGGRGSPNRNQNRDRAHSGNRGQDRGGQQFQNRQRGIIDAQLPPKVTFEDPFDFEKSNEELKTAMEKLKTGTNGSDDEKKESESKEDTEPKKEDPMIYYDKDKFFDNISCEALERSKGKVARVDWRSERKLNAETFGLTWNPNNLRFDNGPRNNFNYRPRGNYRGGYRGGDNQMRFNNYRYNNRNSYGNNYGNNYGNRGQQQQQQRT